MVDEGVEMSKEGSQSYSKIDVVSWFLKIHSFSAIFKSKTLKFGTTLHIFTVVVASAFISCIKLLPLMDC